MWSHNFWHSLRSNIGLSSKLFELATSNLVSGFDLPLLFDCQVLHTILLLYSCLVWGSMVGYPSDNLASCQYRTMILPARCYASADLCDRDVSVRPSVTRRYCIVVISSPPGSSTILVFWCQISSRHSKGFPPGGGLKQWWGGKIQPFLSLSINISTTVP